MYHKDPFKHTIYNIRIQSSTSKSFANIHSTANNRARLSNGSHPAFYQKRVETKTFPLKTILNVFKYLLDKPCWRMS